MSRTYSLLFLVLFCFSMETKLKKTKCIAYGGDCGATAYCCSKLDCIDHRCLNPDKPENLQPPRRKGQKDGGDMCDTTNDCLDGFVCMSHTCYNETEFLARQTKEEADISKLNKAEDNAESKAKKETLIEILHRLRQEEKEGGKKE